MKFVTVLIAAGFVCAALPAHAGVCTKEIAMVTKLLGGGGLGSVAPTVPSAGSTSTLSTVTGGGAASGALGSGATSVANAKQATEAVDQAKVADAAGDETSCMDYINQAKQLLGLIQ